MSNAKIDMSYLIGRPVWFLKQNWAQVVQVSGKWVRCKADDTGAEFSVSRSAAISAEADARANPKLRDEDVISQVAAQLDTTPEDAGITVVTGYDGPMKRLHERKAAGAYQKAPNGQPCCGDAVAVALGMLSVSQVIRACVVAMNLPSNPYVHLNLGQQSMNLRNKLRGALKRGEFGFGVVTEAVEQVQV